MSDLSRNVKIVLNVLVKGRDAIAKQIASLKLLLRGAGRTEDALGGVGRIIGQLGTAARTSGINIGRLSEQLRTLRGVADNVKKSLGQTMNTMQGPSMASGGLFALQEAAEFEEAMIDIKKVVTDLSPDQIDNELAPALRRLATESDKTAVEIAKIAGADVNLGAKGGDLLRFTEEMMKMSTAFKMGGTETAEAMTKIRNVYGLGMDELSKFGDTINVLGNSTTSNEAAIVNAILRMGGSAQNFGLATEETAALATAMLTLGKTPEITGASLTTMLTTLKKAEDQGQDFQEGLEEIGLSASEMSGMIEEGPNDALGNFFTRIQELDDEAAQLNVLEKIFGPGQSKHILTLANSMGVYEKGLGLVNDQTRTSQSVQREYEQHLEGLNAQWSQTKNSLSRVAGTIAQTFFPAIKGALTGVRFLANALGNFAEQHPHIAAGIASLGTALVSLAGTHVVMKLLLGKLDQFGIKVKKLAEIGKIFGGLNLKSWAVNLGTSFTKIAGVARTLWAALNPIAKLMAVFAAGYSFGSWLNQFGIVRKAGLSLVHMLDLVRLKAVKMWKKLTFQDSSGVDKEIQNATKIYRGMLEEIDKEEDEYAQKKAAKKKKSPSEKSQEAPNPAEDPHVPERSESPQPPEPVDRQDQAELPQREEPVETSPPSSLPEQDEEKEASHDPAQEDDRPVQLEEKLPDSDHTSNKTDWKEAGKEQQRQDIALENQEEEQEARLENRREKKKEDKEEKRSQIKNRSGVRSSQGGREDEGQEKKAQGRAEQEKERQKRLASFKEGLVKEEEKHIDQLRDARTQASDTWLEQEKENTGKAQTVFEEYAQRVKKLSSETAQRNRDTQKDLIDLDPLASEESKWKKRAQLAKDYEEQAKEAMAAGDYEKALDLTGKATDGYKDLQNKSGTISESQVKGTVYSGVKSSGELAVAIEELMAQSLSKQGQQKPGAALSAALNKIPGARMGQNTAGKAAAQIQAVKPAQLAQAGAGSIKEKKNRTGMAEIQRPVKTVELSFPRGSLHGSEESVNALLDQLAKAGMRA